MPEEKKETIEVSNSESGKVVEDVDYIAALKKLKDNSVPRTEYEALKADRQRLINTFVNEQKVSEPTPAEAQTKKVYTDEEVANLRKSLTKDCTNLEGWSNALELRKAVMSKGEPDPFLPIGQKIAPTDEDVKCAQKVADIVEECIAYAEGDTEAFTNELMRRTVDVPLPRIRR